MRSLSRRSPAAVPVSANPTSLRVQRTATVGRQDQPLINRFLSGDSIGRVGMLRGLKINRQTLSRQLDRTAVARRRDEGRDVRGVTELWVDVRRDEPPGSSPTSQAS